MPETKKRQPVEMLNHWLHVLDTEGEGLSTFEKYCIQSWQGQIDEGHGLTEVQEEKLCEMYQDHT